MKIKNPKMAMIGGMVSLAAAVFTFICRFFLSSEMNSIKNSGALFVISGSKEMTRSEYIEYATRLITTCTATTVFLLILAGVLFAMYFNMKKKTEN